MSLWFESLSLCLDDCGENSEEIAKCIFAHLSMSVPRQWWEYAMQTGHISNSYVQILGDVYQDLQKCPVLTGRVTFSLLVALAFMDDETNEPKFGTVHSQYPLQEYVARGNKILAERPELIRLGELIAMKVKPFPQHDHAN
jgi:hypothetical protein